jgi:hypothetical protein
MKRREFSKMLGTAAVASAWPTRQAASASAWAFEANIAECCSCAIPCPCNFGLLTKQRCDGNRLIEIYKGHVGGADLAGARFLSTFEMGKWNRIYIDDSLTDQQDQALDALLPLAFGGFVRGARSIERVPMTVVRTDAVIEFSTPASEVQMKPLPGLDGGLITINGLPSNVYFDYVQYQSVRHIHKGPDREWSHTGTNGFISRMVASS